MLPQNEGFCQEHGILGGLWCELHRTPRFLRRVLILVLVNKQRAEPRMGLSRIGR